MNTLEGPSLRRAATLLLAGQLLYIIITQFHTGGDGNDHPAILAAYAGSVAWTAVHLAQFGAMAVLLAGLLALTSTPELKESAAGWAGPFGAASVIATLALYGALQAVDGVALKQAVNAWAGAPDAEKAARFASAEAIRWLEWGLRSYQSFTFAVALLLLAGLVARAARIPRLLGYLIGLSGLTYLVQAWLAGYEGFSPALSIAIVLAWALSLAWMSWLVVIARRLQRGEVTVRST